MKDRYLLLLQLGPDMALNWTVGEMGPLQYWITPEDLAAKRFQNAILTIEAY
ncbi:YwqG family protein [Mesorhizobium sp. M1428]